MADGYIAVAPDSTGKKLQTFENTVGADDVHAEAVVLVDVSGAALAAVPVSIEASIGLQIDNFTPGPVTIAKQGDVASDPDDVGSACMAVRKATPANTSDTDGDYEMLQMSAGRLWVDASGKTLTVALNSFTGAANMANGQVTASTSAGTLVAARATRRSVTIRNTDSAINVFIGVATVTAGNGMILRPGNSISVDFTGLIQVIAASGSPVVSYMETYD